MVDAVIRRLKETLRQDMVEGETQNWAKSLPRAVRAYNNNSHEHLMDSAPADVKGKEVLQYSLKKQAGQDAMINAKTTRRPSGNPAQGGSLQAAAAGLDLRANHDNSLVQQGPQSDRLRRRGGSV